MGLLVHAVQGLTGSGEGDRSFSPAFPPTKTDADHLFANNVRFLSMVAIIALHTVTVFHFLRDQQTPLTLIAAGQLVKFGTIAFFLIAGFLFGERIDLCSSTEYFRRRLKNVFLPWTFWYVAYCVTWMVLDSCRKGSSFDWGTQTRQILSATLLDSAFWFVPNLLMALAVLLIFRKILRDIRFGLFLLAISLFYSVNIYGRWIPVQHTHALFGFIFYLWLGAWGSWHFAALKNWLSRVGTGVLAGAETKLLLSLHSADPGNTLRISNQLYSVLAVLVLFRLKRAVWPRFMNVRADTFGLYLTHCFTLPLVTVAIAKIQPHIGWAVIWDSAPGTVVLMLITFLIFYGGCFLMVRGLLSCRWLRWTVGLAGNGSSASRSPRQRSTAADDPRPKVEKPVGGLSALPIRN